MTYFVIYAVDDPRSLFYGLRVEECPTYAAALAFAQEAIVRRCSGVRLIQGVELAVEETAEPLRRILFHKASNESDYPFSFAR